MVLAQKERVDKILSLLEKTYPNPKTELNFENEMQLAIAVMLSAQTTDKKVNEVTKTLFKKYKTWQDFANANVVELQQDLYGVNFHKGKAKRIIAAASMVVNVFEGNLPRNLAALTELPGVARKSANVILQELWGIVEGVVVDTHITRVSNKLGLTTQKSAVKIEKDLMEILPKKFWGLYSSAIVLHGRYVCIARAPKCPECVLRALCPSRES